MSWDPPNAGPSPAASDPAPAPGPAELTGAESVVFLLQARGAPLLKALDAHYPGSGQQAEAASSYAFSTAVELGLSRPSAELIREGAKLHDVGRVYVPAQVLAKPAWSRTPEEGAQVEAHHEMGAQLARGAGIPDRVCEWIRLGAERYDGGGPHRLGGEAIPLQARISRAAYACYAAVVDGPSAEGPAHLRRGPVDALRGSAGRELDPLVVDALAAILLRAGAI